MAWQLPISQTTTVNLGTTDDVFVAHAVTVTSTSSWAIRGFSSNHEVLIFGTTANSAPGFPTIHLGNLSGNTGNLVTIKPGGHVQHFSTDCAVTLVGFESDVINEGMIASPAGHGIRFILNNPATQSEIFNSGTIEAGSIGIWHDGMETLILTNRGQISGGTASYSGSNGLDLITNTGRMTGDISLFGGNDIYNGASGRLSGTVFGGDGNDKITGGIDNDRFEGGDNNDTLRGNAGNDRLNGNAGNDKLYGDAGNDQLRGWEDKDQLYGGAGNDKLYGGLGNDKLYGGAGTDRAYFDGNKNAYTIKTKGNKTTVKGPDGTDQLFQVEFLVFDNGTITV